MAKFRAKHLPHTVNYRPPAVETAEGSTPGTLVQNRPAYLEQKTRLVIDRRSTSPTNGKEVTSTTFVVLLPVDDVLPGSLVTVWAGTPRERTSEVITSAKFDYPRAPSHVELWLE